MIRRTSISTLSLSFVAVLSAACAHPVDPAGDAPTASDGTTDPASTKEMGAGGSSSTGKGSAGSHSGGASAKGGAAGKTSGGAGSGATGSGATGSGTGGKGGGTGGGSTAGKGGSGTGAAGTGTGTGTGTGGSGAGTGTRTGMGGSGTGTGAGSGSGTGAGGSGNGSAGSGAGNPGGPPISTAWADGVTVHLANNVGATKVASFGVPVPPGMLADAASARVHLAGSPTPIAEAHVKMTIARRTTSGAVKDVAALVVQLPASMVGANGLDVDVLWKGTGAAHPSDVVPFAQTSAASAETIDTATRTIQKTGNTYSLAVMSQTKQTLFTGTEPGVLATFPAGYLATTGVLGGQISKGGETPDLPGTAYLGKALEDFALSAMYQLPYAVDPQSVIDPVTNYEGWLYDRCATFLTAYSYGGNPAILRHALRSCSYYEGTIDGTGIFTGKTPADPKYSHARGLYAYYALTGDEAAPAAIQNIASMWLTGAGAFFVAPYRAGKVTNSTTSNDKLWTERLLSFSLEGSLYAFALTGDPTYYAAANDLVTTAHAHITGDAATLAKINPFNNFPPQNCFIHNAAQQSEGNATDPWCSAWMSELMVDPLLHFEELTGDGRAPEIFVRLARFLRDTGSSYFDSNPVDDTFLAPKGCYKASDGDNARMLIPLYGAGRNATGARQNFGEYDDYEHCPDASALTAAGLWGLAKKGTFDQNPVGPFPSEGASFVAMHNEFSSCADRALQSWYRPNRDPGTWTSATLSAGAGSPASFIASNKIGWPERPTDPLRKISWWFNTSMLQHQLLRGAGVSFPTAKPGQIQPAGCPLASESLVSWRPPALVGFEQEDGKTGRWGGAAAVGGASAR